MKIKEGDKVEFKTDPEDWDKGGLAEIRWARAFKQRYGSVFVVVEARSCLVKIVTSRGKHVLIHERWFKVCKELPKLEEDNNG